MAMRFTSNSLGTYIRKAVVALRSAPVSTGTATQHARRISESVRIALRSTFPSISTPAHQLSSHLPGPGHLARRFASTNSMTTPTPQALLFRRAGIRPSARLPRGPAVPASVGLGKARTFASTSPVGSLPGNVPVVLRAFIGVFDEEEERIPLPRPSRYMPYQAPARRNTKTCRRREQRRTSSLSLRDSALLRELGHYFPLPVVADIKIDLPPKPEHLVTPGTTTTLALPLAPSLHSLLAPMVTIPYADAEIGVAILARLTHGFLPLHEAYDTYGSTRVIPLLARLDALGVLIPPDPIKSIPRVELELVTDSLGHPDVLRVIFIGRSASNVHALLTESLCPTEEGEWWILTEEKVVSQPLTHDERKEMMEEWGPKNDHLIMPTIDVSIMPDLPTPPPSDFWSSSKSSSPPLTPGEPDDGEDLPFSLNQDSWPMSSTDSLVSAYTGSIVSAGTEFSWSIPPSDEDADVESAWADSESETYSDYGEYAGGGSVGAWVGERLGLAQPW